MHSVMIFLRFTMQQCRLMFGSGRNPTGFHAKAVLCTKHCVECTAPFDLVVEAGFFWWICPEIVVLQNGWLPHKTGHYFNRNLGVPSFLDSHILGYPQAKTRCIPTWYDPTHMTHMVIPNPHTVPDSERDFRSFHAATPDGRAAPPKRL